MNKKKIKSLEKVMETYRKKTRKNNQNNYNKKKVDIKLKQTYKRKMLDYFFYNLV